MSLLCSINLSLKADNDFLPVINGESKISLRLLEWVVTNYSKKNNINYLLKKKNRNINFIAYLDYKAQLKAYSKKQFDPFCRRERISLLDNNDEEIITTVGQLNFFRWAIDNNILKYIYENFEMIEQDMIESVIVPSFNVERGKNNPRKVTKEDLTDILLEIW